LKQKSAKWHKLVSHWATLLSTYHQIVTVKMMGDKSKPVIDLTNIPDIDIPPNKPRPMNDQSHGNPDRGGGVGLITEAACLQMVLDVLPAISVDYVLNLIQNKTTDQTRSVAQCEQIILQLLEGTHPTEADAVNQKKRKREDEDENISRMARGEYRQPCFYENDA
jgi:TRIAD3 protein (E3 ubiquitin-protein ligase RNF216)